MLQALAGGSKCSLPPEPPRAVPQRPQDSGVPQGSDRDETKTQSSVGPWLGWEVNTRNGKKATQ